MHLQKIVDLIVALLVALCLGISILGCATSQISVSDIPIQGAITHVHAPDNSSNTYIDVYIEKGFKDNLPEDIDSITVTGPNGKLPIGKDDFTYYPQFRYFWISFPGSPATGTYTFTVTSGDKTGSATDTQTALKSIPIPDTGTFSPSEGKAPTCKMPPFTWNAVEAGIPLYYRLEIMDMQNNSIYTTNYGEDVLFIRLPPDLLKVGQTYRWRVRAVDGANWITLNNRSHSQWLHFSVGPTQSECEYKYQIPTETGDGWETSSLEAENVDLEKIEELMRKILNDNLKNIHSILVVKNGRLILDEYFSGYHRNLKHTVQSVTKSVTSILFGIARDQGEKIVLEDKLFNYLPEYKGLDSNDVKNEITLKHLLTMKAGLEWLEPNSIHYMLKSKDCVKYVLERELVDPPGEIFFYSTGVSTVLGKILKNTTGSDADQFADKHLFTPLGITDYSWYKLPDGSVSTGWGLYLRPRDMAKLGYLFLKNGTWKEKQIVSKKWVGESIYPHVIYPHVRGDLISGTGYGYQWWRGATKIGDQKIDSFYAAGHGGQMIFVIPGLDLITVITSQAHNNNAGDFRAYSALENYIIPAVLQTDPVRKIPPFNVENYRHVTGKYRWPKAKLNMKIYIDNGKIYGNTILFDGKFELLPVEKDRFMCVSEDIGNFWLEIMQDSKGDIEGVKLIIGFSYLPFKRIRGLFFGI
jgi:CubicO group peptidase (beta-lactamase class C family)